MREPEFTSYDRAVLYEQVWAEPVREVARRYGVSDVALAKACRRLSVPLPGRGYWAKRRAGKAPPRPPLPEAPVRRRPPVTRPPARASSSAAKPPVAEIPVPALRRPHELVAAARDALEEARTWNGLASCGSAKGCLDITVSKAQRKRALRVMDALVKYLEAHEGGVEVARRQESRYGYVHEVSATEALVGGERVAFALRERDGLLELRITNDRLQHLRRTWSDGKRQRLEDVLGGFVGGLRGAAVRLAEIHAEDARRERAWREEQLRRAEEAERRRRGEEKIARLTGEASSWSRAAELRAYARAGLQLLSEADAQDESAEARRADLVWLLEYADSIDPLLHA